MKKPPTAFEKMRLNKKLRDEMADHKFMMELAEKQIAQKKEIIENFYKENATPSDKSQSQDTTWIKTLMGW